MLDVHDEPQNVEKLVVLAPVHAHASRLENLKGNGRKKTTLANLKTAAGDSTATDNENVIKKAAQEAAKEAKHKFMKTSRFTTVCTKPPVQLPSNFNGGTQIGRNVGASHQLTIMRGPQRRVTMHTATGGLRRVAIGFFDHEATNRTNATVEAFNKLANDANTARLQADHSGNLDPNLLGVSGTIPAIVLTSSDTTRRSALGTGAHSNPPPNRMSRNAYNGFDHAVPAPSNARPVTRNLPRDHNYVSEPDLQAAATPTNMCHHEDTQAIPPTGHAGYDVAHDKSFGPSAP